MLRFQQMAQWESINRAMVQIFWHRVQWTQTRANNCSDNSNTKCFPGVYEHTLVAMTKFQLKLRHHWQPTGLSGEDAHEARKERVDSSQDFGVATGHACSYAPLEGFKVGQDGWGLQHCQQEAENLQSSADVGDVSLCWLLLRGHRGEHINQSAFVTKGRNI